MAQLICRIPRDTLPAPAETEAAGISAWLVGVRLLGDGTLAIRAPDLWLERPESSLPFCLEWELPEPLTPKEERLAAALLGPWLAHPHHLRWRGQTPLWIADPERLSHTRLACQRLRLQLGPGLTLWGGGLLGLQLDGCYDRPARDIDCRPANARQRHYGSFLHHAHHRRQPDGKAAVIPAVLPLRAGAEEDGFCGGTAECYREWLEQTLAWAELWQQPADDGLVLVENWEGHRRWSPPSASSASPPATTARPSPTSSSLGWGEMVADNPAVLLHGFHLDLLGQTLQELRTEQNTPIDLYISTPLEQQTEAAALVKTQGWQRVEIVGIDNRGRDIAPFLLELLPRALANGHPWLLKLHTKRSEHLAEGDQWSQHLRRTLAQAAARRLLDDWFAADSSLGLIAPPGSLHPCTVSLNQNAKHLKSLLPRLQLRGKWFLQQSFVAGSMFAARSQALAPLTKLNLQIDDFEAEMNQRDGTLAHALERLMMAVVTDAGLLVRELPGNHNSIPLFGHGWAAPFP